MSLFTQGTTVPRSCRCSFHGRGDAVGLAAASARATKPMEVDLSQVLTPRFALRYGDAQSSDLDL